MVTHVSKTLFCALLLWSAMMPSAWAAVEISVDRSPVQVNESFQLTFTLDFSPDQEPDFSPLQQHFLILNNRRSNSISIVNGEYKRSITWAMQVMAKQEGEYVIPAIRFDQERSKPLQISVKPSSPDAVAQDQFALELLADRQQALVQGQVLLRLRLLSATDLSAYQFGKLTLEGADAVLEPLGDESQFQTRIGERNYLVLEKRYALYPQQAGRIEIAPVMAEVRLPSRQRYDPFQTGGEVRRLRSQRLAIDIDPIPTGYTAPFWLPAKSVKLVEDWPGDLTGLIAGEPITRSLSLIADGLTAAQLPEIALPQIGGVKQYPDQPVLDDRPTTKGIIGSRVQKVALIPAAEGRYLIPEIRLPWWNLETGKTETAILPARVLQVAPAAIVAPPPSPAAAPSAPPSANVFWLWLSLILALGWIGTLVLWWLRSRPRVNLAESPSLRAVRRQLQQACAADDAAAARLALLAWGRALFAPRQIDHLPQLVQLLGAELGAEVARLNQSLYATAPSSWRGESLWRLCRHFEQRSNAAESPPAAGELVPLNPGN